MPTDLKNRQKALYTFFGRPINDMTYCAVLKKDHAKAAQVLINSAYKTDPIYKKDFTRIPDDKFDQFVKDNFSTKKIMYGYFDKGVLVACACLDITTGEIGLFSTHPIHRGKIIGNQLLNFVKAKARDDHGLKIARLNVIDLPPHASLFKKYEQEGFQRSGKSKKSLAMEDIDDKFKHNDIQALEMTSNL